MVPGLKLGFDRVECALEASEQGLAPEATGARREGEGGRNSALPELRARGEVADLEAGSGEQRHLERRLDEPGARGGERLHEADAGRGRDHLGPRRERREPRLRGAAPAQQHVGVGERLDEAGRRLRAIRPAGDHRRQHRRRIRRRLVSLVGVVAGTLHAVSVPLTLVLPDAELTPVFAAAAVLLSLFAIGLGLSRAPRPVTEPGADRELAGVAAA